MMLAACLLLAAAAPPEPTGFRMDRYGAPTPAGLRGARVIDTAQAQALWEVRLARNGAVFVDVLPRPPKPAGLPPGTLWQDLPHDDIPGSLWLPDTGYGALAPAVLAYFTQGLARATGGDLARTLVIYCKPQCWMSWNAARRAVALGYTRVDWYPGGVADWRKAGLPVERRRPEARPDS